MRRLPGVLVLPLTALVVGACGGTASPAPGGGAASASTGGAARSSTPAAVGSADPSAAGVGSQRPAPVESNPPGDIPDNIAYVAYRSATGRYTFLHPEGWAGVTHGSAVTFTDKLNGITAAAAAATAAPTATSAKQELTRLRTSQPAFELREVKPLSLPAGAGVLIVFRRNSAADPVTGRVFRDEVNRYEIYRGGRLVVLELYGAVGSDNVDPYTKISRSLRMS